jgi:hypothetical protein
MIRKKVIAAKAAEEQTFRMPTEVSEWIERASSTMKHQKSKIDDLTEENNKLKIYKKWAEKKILSAETDED